MANETIGVIYLAFGQQYLVQAICSAQSARAHCCNIPLTIVTNVRGAQRLVKNFLDETVVVELNLDDDKNRLIKTSIFEHANHDINIFIDCDTVVHADLQNEVERLPYFDVAAHKIQRKAVGRQASLPLTIRNARGQVRDFPVWNSGVVLFRRNDAAQKLFATWYKNFQTLEHRVDQPAFAKTILEDEFASILNLPIRWNDPNPPARPDSKTKTEIIVQHYMYAMPIDVFEQCTSVLNVVKKIEPEHGFNHLGILYYFLKGQRKKQLKRNLLQQTSPNSPLKDALRTVLSVHSCIGIGGWIALAKLHLGRSDS